ncbi:MAG: hypothetical protein K9N49_10420, partial [Candidatus Marinimicrobia bacterium]|nr:hypothetical protein [Candidatus Neomarinimicrobiota bacterium]
PRLLGAVRHPLWGRQAGFAARPTPRESRLIGATRAGAITTNVVLPWLVATGRCPPDSTAWAKALPPEAENAIQRQTLHTLFGPDAPESLARHPLRRQGLIQIFQDFCLTDRTDCTQCPLLNTAAKLPLPEFDP